MYYGRNRENFFSKPSSVVEEAIGEKSLLIQSVLKEREFISNKTKDVNELILEAFEDEKLSDICKSKNTEKFINYLIDKNILVAESNSSLNNVRGWFKSESVIYVQTYAAGHTMVGSEAAVFLIAIAVGVTVAVNKPGPEEKRSASFELKNSIYKNCSLLATKLGGDEFGLEIYNFFGKLENGTYKLLQKDDEISGNTTI
ncbi:hypothetical protein HAX44_00215 [Enterococcus faecalis]|uniref:hypothetical protein n=1 Tax=Enterococcus faecalis TaxID=1351 RepID=UPI0018839926|nr:hypothetical protein [Enterococcus faecalis]MBF0004022.1 hypothetical protein [Enterococcus faecalis]MBF0006705.1 hypothetical protein [Enterococcus faecalis]